MPDFDDPMFARRAVDILRIVSAALFLEHGTQKLFGLPAGEFALAATGTLPWVAGVIELVTGVLLLPGLWTRPAAFVASGEMAVGYWLAHAPRGPFPASNGGDAAVLFCFVFLLLAAARPGEWSIDALIARRRNAPPPR